MKKWLFCLCICFIQTHVFSQHFDALNAIVLGTAQGLPDALVTSVCQDDDGFLWVGTSNGLSRYDGVDFVNFFHTADTTSIPGNFIAGITKMHNHCLLINTRTGLCVFDTRTLKARNFLAKASEKTFSFENNFLSAAIDSLNNIWAGTQTCLYKFDTSLHVKQLWRGFREDEYGSQLVSFVMEIQALQNGDMLLRLHKPNDLIKYFVYNNNSQTIEEASKTKSYSFLKNDVIQDICLNKNGNIYFIKLFVDSIFCFNKKLQQTVGLPLNKTHGETQISYSSKLFIPQENVLAYSFAEGGIGFMFIDKNENIFFKNIIAAGKAVFCMLRDNIGNYWLGTNEGLIKFSVVMQQIEITQFPSFNTVTNEASNLQNIYIYNGSAFIGTNGNGFFYKKDSSEEWKHYSWFSQKSENDIWDIHSDSSEIFFVSDYPGLYRWNSNSNAKNLVSWPAGYQWINGFAITTIFNDSRNETWFGIGGGKGVACYNKITRQIKVYSIDGKYFFPLRYPTAITEDINGNIWMGGVNGNGLAEWDRSRDSFKLFIPRYNTNFDNGIINCLLADNQNRIWIGTTSGISVFDEHTNSFIKYDVSSGLPSNTINAFAKDKNGFIWIATGNGVCYISQQTRQITSVDQFKNLPEHSVNSIKYDSITNHILFVTDKFLYNFPCDIFFNNIMRPQIFISQVSSAGKPLNFLNPINLEYNSNTLNISFTAVNLLDGESNKYYYKLNNASEWILLGKSRAANFSNLAPGKYTFQVKAQTSSGLFSQIASVSFIIASPFWKTWWFILSCVLIIFIIVFLLYRYRVKQILHFQNVRNAIASDLHDEIGSTLTNINILAELTKKSDDSKRIDLLSRIGEEVNASGQSLDDIVWSINPQNDSFQQITARMRRYASELFEAASINYTFEFDEIIAQKKLSMEQRRDLYLIYRETLNNVYKHAGASFVNIYLVAEKNNFILIVQDNGKGFNTAGQTARNGIKNIKQRVAKWNGEFSVLSAHGQGSTITVRMPYKN